LFKRENPESRVGKVDQAKTDGGGGGRPPRKGNREKLRGTSKAETRDILSAKEKDSGRHKKVASAKSER